MKSAAEYAYIIMRDETDKIASETPTVYTEDKIERIYEFTDGAVIKYEWQSSPAGRTHDDELYNHKFTLTTPPSPNPHKFKTGVVKVINYPK